MTNSLKTFTAGEKIKASETNSNNQYLLGQITSSATTLKNYVDNAIATLSGNFVLPGMIIALPHSTVPTGYLLCDGSSLLRTSYANLFNAIGTIYGSVDSTHFNIPDFRGKFLRGYKSDVSASLGTLQNNGAPNITGNFNQADVLDSPMANGAFYLTGSGQPRTGGGGSANRKYVAFDASRSSSVYQNNLSEIRPDNYAVCWVIKY